MVRGKVLRDGWNPYLQAIPTDREIKKDGVLTPLILSSSNRNLMGRISRNGIRSIMNKALTACDLKHPGYSCHVFRHSCGTNLYKETKDLEGISADVLSFIITAIMYDS